MYPSKSSFTILLEVWAIMFSLDKALDFERPHCWDVGRYCFGGVIGRTAIKVPVVVSLYHYSTLEKHLSIWLLYIIYA